jgi:hypothetical protein
MAEWRGSLLQNTRDFELRRPDRTFIQWSFVPHSRVQPLPRGWITNGLPALLRGSIQPLSDGTSCWIGFFKTTYPVQGAASDRLIDVLACLTESGHTPQVNPDILDGRSLVCITDLFSNQYWLDPALNFALVHASSPTDTFTVQKFLEAAPGVWYPSEGFHDLVQMGPDPIKQRVVFRIKKVVVNDPSLTDAIFQPTFPKGSRVRNETSGQMFISDGIGDQLFDSLEADVAKADVGSVPKKIRRCEASDPTSDVARRMGWESFRPHLPGYCSHDRFDLHEIPSREDFQVE